MRILIALFMLVGLSTAQTARVVPLSQQDATTAQSLQQQLISLNRQIEVFNQSIVQRYLLVTTGTCWSGYRVGEKYPGTGLTMGTPTSGTQSQYLSGSGWVPVYGNNCQTAQERQKEEREQIRRDKAQADRDKAQAEYEKLHPRLYWLWCDTEQSFEYSSDYNYIVPKPVTRQTSTGITWATDGGGGSWIATPQPIAGDITIK